MSAHTREPATLLPMMIALEMTVSAQGSWRRSVTAVISHAARHLPFALFLIGFLVVAYVVNSRHYVVREGYYAVGWHAVANVFDSIVAIYVWERQLSSYIAISAIAALLLWRGGPRVRFLVVWIVVTVLPFVFLTWGTASRYLYLPAAGFAMLLSMMMIPVHHDHRRKVALASDCASTCGRARLGHRVRSAVFAKKGVDEFRQRTLPYERFVAAVSASSRTVTADGMVHVAATDADGMPPLYRDAAAQVGLCTPNVRVALH